MTSDYPITFSFSAYLERAIESALEAFQMYDVDPKDGRLTYEEIKPVSTFIQFNRNSKTFRIVEIGLKKCIHLIFVGSSISR